MKSSDWILVGAAGLAAYFLFSPKPKPKETDLTSLPGDALGWLGDNFLKQLNPLNAFGTAFDLANFASSFLGKDAPSTPSANKSIISPSGQIYLSNAGVNISESWGAVAQHLADLSSGRQSAWTLDQYSIPASFADPNWLASLRAKAPPVTPKPSPSGGLASMLSYSGPYVWSGSNSYAGSNPSKPNYASNTTGGSSGQTSTSGNASYNPPPWSPANPNAYATYSGVLWHWTGSSWVRA